MPYDPTWHFWERITRALETHARAAKQASRTQAEALELAREIWAWVKRMALAAFLWGTSAGVLIGKEQLADAIVAFLKR